MQRSDVANVADYKLEEECVKMQPVAGSQKLHESARANGHRAALLSGG